MADTQKALGAIVQTLYVSLTVDKKSKSVVQGYNVVGSGAYWLRSKSREPIQRSKLMADA